MKNARGALGKSSNGSPAFSATKLLIDISFLRIVLTLLLSPFQKLLAWQLFCGRSFLHIAAHLKRVLLTAIGWLSAQPRSQTLRYLLSSFTDVRRWHLVAGKPSIFDFGRHAPNPPVFRFFCHDADLYITFALYCNVPIAFPKVSHVFSRRRVFFTSPTLLHLAAALVTYSAISSALRVWRESKDEVVQQRRSLQRKMAASKSYFEWSINAAKLDRLDGTDEEARWRSETKLYDRRLLQDKISHLRAVNSSNSTVRERMFAVRADLLRNLGNMASSALHEHFPLVPIAIREYIDEVRTHLEDITHSPELPLPEKAAFLKETRHAFGRTALVLSGGGALGTFHLGVVKALLEHNFLPRVLAGSSVGAVVCALVATRKDDELSALLEDIASLDLTFFSHTTAVPAATASLLFNSAPPETPEELVKRLRHLLGDLTFLEAYTLTGRVLNISVAAAGGSGSSSRFLNYLTAPHVVLWSAVACSSAFPGLPQPRELLARAADGELVRFAAGEGPGGASTIAGWHDGSLEEDLPMRGLSEMFSVNHFIVSQTSPHIIPFLNLKRQLGVVGQLAEAEIKHRCRQALEVLPKWRWPARWLRAFSQPWEGDITIVLPDAVAQLTRAVTGPSRRNLLDAVRAGELCTWAKLSAIQCNCGIEVTMDACIQQVAAEERAAQRKRHAVVAPLKKGRLPSWADLEGLHRKFTCSSSTESLLSLTFTQQQQHQYPMNMNSATADDVIPPSSSSFTKSCQTSPFAAAAAAVGDVLPSSPLSSPQKSIYHLDGEEDFNGGASSISVGVPAAPSSTSPLNLQLLRIPSSFDTDDTTTTTGVIPSSTDHHHHRHKEFIFSASAFATSSSTSTPPSTMTTKSGFRYAPDAAYECTDTSVNPFHEATGGGAALSPRGSGFGFAALSPVVDSGSFSTRNSLDWIAP